MTEISFHFNVPDRLAYACRLLRKASRLGAGVAVVGSAKDLAALDRALWTFEQLDFVPHLRVAAGQEVPARLAHTPVWLVDDVADAHRFEVLLSLHADVPRGYESFARLIEIVTASETDRQQARDRWKHYAGRGYPIVRHDVSE